MAPGAAAGSSGTRETAVSAPALAALRLHPIATDVVIMAGLGLLFVVPAVYLFGKTD